MGLDLQHLGRQFNPRRVPAGTDVDDHFLAAWLGVCEDFTQPSPKLGHYPIYQLVLPASLSCCHPRPFMLIPYMPVRIVAQICH